MKIKFLFYMITLAVIGSCTQEKSSPVEGTWALISGHMASKDTVMNYGGPGEHNLKSIGKHHFLTVWQDTTLNKTDFWRQGFNAGTYTFKDGIYSENISHFNAQGSIGDTYSFKTIFSGDTLILTNIEKDGSSMVEKWKRIE